MTEKIEWYQEVLELEPSSKVFFPLAKLLAANGQISDAITTLRQGLDRHPEFFEARLMLIDLLQKAGQSSEGGAKDANLTAEIDKLGSKLKLYPGFWTAWASASQQEGNHDVAVALRLLSVFLEGNQVTLADVLDYGLKAVSGQSFLQGNAAAAEVAEPVPAEPAPDANLPLDLSSKIGELNAAVESVIAPPANAPVVLPKEELSPEADTDTDEENFSLRTRTMAGLLVEQGDYQGALDIYKELFASSSNDEQRSEMAKRIAELEAKIKQGEAAAKLEEAAPEEPLQGKQKLLDALEFLAKRLEMRAGE